MDKVKELETKPIGQLLLTYALPAVITQVVASIYNIVRLLSQNNGKIL